VTASDEQRAAAADILELRPEEDRYELPVPETARGHRTRTALLDAAEAVFGDLGYERASITAITQSADVAQGTFYKYFPSKHAIFVELVTDFAVRVRHALAEAAHAAPEGSRAEVERRGFEAMFAFALEHPGLYHVVRESQFVAPATYRWYYESFVSAYIQSFPRLAGRSRKKIDVETLGWSMAGIADMLGLRWVIWEHRLPPASALDQLVELLAHGFEGMLDRP
jgi:AcrR family transcriptional regulator